MKLVISVLCILLISACGDSFSETPEVENKSSLEVVNQSIELTQENINRKPIDLTGFKYDKIIISESLDIQSDHIQLNARELIVTDKDLFIKVSSDQNASISINVGQVIGELNIESKPNLKIQIQVESGEIIKLGKKGE